MFSKGNRYFYLEISLRVSIFIFALFHLLLVAIDESYCKATTKHVSDFFSNQCTIADCRQRFPVFLHLHAVKW